jgi:hypothetical protein
MDERLEFVFIHDAVRDGPCGYPEVFILTGISERGDEVEIGKIHAKELGTSCRDSAVHEKFGGGEISSGGVGFTLIINKIAANCPADAVGIRLLWSIVGTDAKVRWFFAFR